MPDTPPNAPTPENQPQPEPQESGGGEDQQVISRAQERIAQLSRQVAEKDRSLELAAETEQRLLEKVQAHIDSRLGSQQPASASRDRDFFPRQSGNQAPQPEDIQSVVKQAVQEAVGQLESQRLEQERLANSQRSSFGQAQKLLPGLAKEGTHETQLWNQLWQSRPDLQGLEDGPLIVAGLVNAALADARAGSSPENRTAAGIGPATLPASGPSVKTQDSRQDPKELLRALTEKGQVVGLTPQEETDMIRLKLAAAEQQRE